MSRSKTRWVCQQCGFQSSRFLGKCTECASWNSMVEEEILPTPSGVRGTAVSLEPTVPILLGEIDSSAKVQRIATGFAGVDEVLGGGLAPGSVVLLAGDPGIGKSTLLLQLCSALSLQSSVAYISGEESAQQVQMRAQRLKVQGGNIVVSCQQNVLAIEKTLHELGSASASQGAASLVVIIDSIQSLYHPEITSAPGSVSQVRESAAVLTAAAKAKNICVIMVGHVTKDGSIAGPRVLEHMVDVVLQFECDSSRQLRVLRAAKNRFGSTQEIAIFNMDENGLVEVEGLGALFLGSRLAALQGKRAASGTAVTAVVQGSRALLLEVQALVGVSPYPNPRRVATGLTLNRLLQILAVLEKRAGLDLSHQDVYLNIAGGFEFDDPAGDLGIAAAIATSYFDRSLDPNLVLIGEIGLTGQVRPVAGIEQRLKEIKRMGFSRVIVPEANTPISSISGLEVLPVEFLSDALAQFAPSAGIGPGARVGVGV